jgi:hypothetical protein
MGRCVMRDALLTVVSLMLVVVSCVLLMIASEVPSC